MAIGSRQDRARIGAPAAPEPGPSGFFQRVARALGEVRLAVPETGRALLNFGAGATDAQAAIVGQAAINADSIVHAELSLEPTADHSADAHLSATFTVRAGQITPGVGFVIFGRSPTSLTGTWSVVWSWS